MPEKSWWQSLIEFFTCPPAASDATAVCIPPGARLILRGFPADLQRQYHISAEEGVVFTQLSADLNTFRDAVRFTNGMEMRLQSLPEGMCVEVLSLAGTREHETAGAFIGQERVKSRPGA